MRNRLPMLLVLLLSLAPIACRKSADSISEHPYFIQNLNDCWESTSRSLRSAQPNLSFGISLDKCIDRLEEGLEYSYNAGDREQVRRDFHDFHLRFRQELCTKLDIRLQSPVLTPGATVQDVIAIVDKYHAEYKKLLAKTKL